MARTVAKLPGGARITDHVTLGVIAKTFPAKLIGEVLAETGRASVRQRDLPAHVVVYYVIALALYMQVSCREVLRCLLQGVAWLAGPERAVRVAGRSGISQARARLGAEPLRLLHDRVVGPLAGDGGEAAPCLREWRLVSLDGSVLDVPDTPANAAHFDRPRSGRGSGAYPQLRFVTLVENATRVLFGTRMGTFRTGEVTLARDVVGHLKPGMLCLADRGFLGHTLWNTARATGADLLWRGKRNLRLECVQALDDGSYLSAIKPPRSRGQRGQCGQQAVPVRVIEYRLEGAAATEPFYRLVTTILDPLKAPADELAALYARRWEVETTLDELKTHLRGAKIVLRSKQPEMVEQEFFGVMMAHFAVRALMHEAADKAEKPPGSLSFVHTVRIIRRKMAYCAALPPSATANRARRSRPRSA